MRFFYGARWLFQRRRALIRNARLAPGTLRTGAVGDVLKHDALGRLAEVVSEVSPGGAPMSPAIARRVVSAFQQSATTPELTPREVQVLRHLAQGLSYAEVASALAISIDTVRGHIRKIYDRLHVVNTAEAVAYALRSGLRRAATTATRPRTGSSSASYWTARASSRPTSPAKRRTNSSRSSSLCERRERHRRSSHRSEKISFGVSIPNSSSLNSIFVIESFFT
ncbi:MAG: response regulator transcription factor [Myxococcaceae bacterium]|nr:response regulator transcription factor [Myxococcaceae bacterium]